MWTGLSAWLAHHLRVNIEMKLLHLLRDTKEFVDDLKHVHWQDGMRMVKIDIKEFYMSRKRGFLSHACSELFCDETEDFQQLVAKAVDRLCRYQYVQSEFLPDLTYRVTRGSGMGLLHNGDVSDAGFWIAAQRWLFNTSLRQWCSLTYWRRFRDDIFEITSNFFVSNMFSVGSALVQHSRVTSSWQKTSEQDHFLGYRCLGGQWLFCDETEKKGLLPLSPVSTVLNPRHEHISWPCSVAKSFGSICLHRKEQRAAENDFLTKLQRFFTCPTTSFESQTVFG